MCIIVWLRTKVTIKQTDLAGLEKYKHPTFPGLAYEKNTWKWDPDYVNSMTAPFMEYAGYTPSPPIHPGQDLAVEGFAGDWSSQSKCSISS